MAILKAFKGWRPPVEIVKELASRPYDVLNSKGSTRRRQAAGNPHSLLAIIKPEIDRRKISTYTAKRFIIKQQKTLSFSATKVACSGRKAQPVYLCNDERQNAVWYRRMRRRRGLHMNNAIKKA